jgi:hypothetical protein
MSTSSRFARSVVVPARVMALTAAALLAALPVAAQPTPPEDLPPELRSWVRWVLEDVPEHGCVKVADIAVCTWPGRLQLSLGETGGTFELSAAADRAADLALPGDLQRWPQSVTLDGRPVPVVERSGVPTVRLPAGTHVVQGRFAWPRLPDALAVPPSLALVDLAVGGRGVGHPRRDDDGLWLREEAAGPAAEGEALQLQVFRKVMDGIPLQVETVLQLEVSGKAREVDLAGALLPGAVPLAVSGELPARLDAEGNLRVQVRAGQHTVSVLSRVSGRPEALAAPSAGLAEAWPEREVWVFQSNEALRQVELAGPPAVDPSRTDLPADWRSLPAFLVAPGERLALKEVRRGQPEAPPDALHLQRELWLDVAGGAFTVRDTWSGALNRTSRLDLLPPGELGRAEVNGEDQLVTADPATRAPGVEVRSATLQLVADSRVPRTGATPAVGWSASVEQLSAVLHLPPGWSLFATSGVDTAPNAWTARWNLLGFFFVLIVALAVARLFGRQAGLLALCAMVVSYGEPDAPEVAWLVLVGAVALRRVATEGWLGRIGRLAFLVSAVVLGLMLVGFAVRQVRSALYPQTAEYGESFRLADMAMVDKAAPAGAMPQAPAPLESQANVPSTMPPSRSRVASDEYEKKKDGRGDLALNQALEQDPHAVMQTGPGVPTWSWRSHGLRWSGPVSREQTMRLWLVSPNLNRLLTLVRLVLLGLLAALLLGLRPPRRDAPPQVSLEAAAPLLVALLLLAGSPVQAQDTPSPEVLEQLKQRLTRPAPCGADCVSTASVVLRIEGDRLVFSAEVHAEADTTWPLPGPAGSWVPTRVTVGGAPYPALARLGDGFLHVRLRPGVHRVEASGPTPREDSLTLQMPEPPRQARVEAPDWEVVGLREEGASDGSIQLTRRLRRGGAEAHAEGVYPPWLEVDRTLQAGVSWRASTTVRRVSPTGTPVSVRIPLLPGESVTTPGYTVEKGELVLALGRDQQEAGWTSRLEPQAQLTLQAPDGKPWSEVWRLQCGVVWQCTFEGLVPEARQRDGLQEPMFRPWPGESLKLTFAHPAGVPGQTITLDAVSLEVTPGARLEKGSLQMTTRASRDESLVIGVPADVEVQGLTVDGAPRPARAENGQVRLTVPAGRHAVALTWQQPRGVGVHYRVPAVTLGRPAVNVSVVMNVPDNRWLLFVHGPSWGPSILFWGYLLVVVAAAWALSRIPGSPLTAREWVLLGLGLSQVEGIVALVVAGFLLALAWRCRRPPSRAVVFDLLQLVLAGWALATLVCLYGTVHHGLLVTPDMQVAGNGSTGGMLRWYVDRIEGATPSAGVVSLPLWLYRGAMLAWALWLAASLVRWTAWAWRCFNEGGLWRPILFRRRPAEDPDPDPVPPAPNVSSEENP